MEPTPKLKASHLFVQAMEYASKGPEEVLEGANRMSRTLMRRE
jgi:hypothetical protein